MNSILRSFAGFLFLLLHFTSAAQQEDIYGKERTLEFADYLMTAHEYNSAALEYERLLFMDAKSDSIKLNLLRAYRLGNFYQQGISRFEDFYSPSNPEIPQVFAHEYLKLLLLERRYQQSQTFLQNNQRIASSYKSNVQLGIMLLQKDWAEAHTYSANAEVTDPYLEGLAGRGVTLKRKSPFLASVMSAVVPGSGKMYTGNWADGAIALIFVGSNAFAAYRGFSRNGSDSFYGWFFTAMGTGFYVGNIYGSHKSAKDYNAEKENLLHHEVENYFYTRY